MSSEFEPKQHDFNPSNQFGGQQQLPNSTGALVLGILSLVFCNLIGIIMGIIAIYLSNQSEKIYLANPQTYTEASYKNLKAGKTCGIIGICLGSAVMILIIIYFVVLGSLIAGAAWH